MSIGMILLLECMPWMLKHPTGAREPLFGRYCWYKFNWCDETWKHWMAIWIIPNWTRGWINPCSLNSYLVVLVIEFFPRGTVLYHPKCGKLVPHNLYPSKTTKHRCLQPQTLSSQWYIQMVSVLLWCWRYSSLLKIMWVQDGVVQERTRSYGHILWIVVRRINGESPDWPDTHHNNTDKISHGIWN